MTDTKPESNRGPSVGYTPDGILLTDQHGPFDYKVRIGTSQVDDLIEALEAAKEGYKKDHTYLGERE